MPELPEVETVRRGLEQKLNNFIIKRVEVCRDSTVAFPNNKEEFINGLQNSLLYKWDRRGKYLIAELKKIQNENIQFPLKKSLKNNGFLVVHLRMTGYFKFINNNTLPCKHTRIRFFDKKNNELLKLDRQIYGPITIQSKSYEKIKSRKVLNVLNQENKKLILSINCDTNELDVRIPGRKWRGGEPPKEEFEKNLINDFC